MSRNRLISFFLLWLSVLLPLAFAAQFIIKSERLLLFLAPLAALALAFSLERFIKGKKEAAHLAHFQQLLSLLASRVSAGQTLESALTEAAPTLEKELGPKNTMVGALFTLRQQMLAHISQEAALSGLATHFKLNRIRTQLAVLSPLSRHGGRLDVFLRRSHDALNKERQMQLDVAAERSQTSSETAVLLVLPYVVAAAMSGQYSDTFSALAWHRLASAVIFTLTIVAACSAILIVSPEREKRKRAKAKRLSAPKRPPTFFRHIYLHLLPAGLGYRLKRMAETVYPDSQVPFDAHLARKPTLLLLGAIVVLLVSQMTTLSPFIYPLILLLPLISHDYDLYLKEKARVESYRLLLPVILNLLAVLLESGLTLDTALKVLPLQHIDDTPPGAGYALKRMRQKLQLGESSDLALTELAERCPIADLSAALHLAARYQRQGGHELIELLQQTAENSWQIYRQAMRTRLEKRSLYLMLPMGLDLLAVIAIAVMPAIASFSLY